MERRLAAIMAADVVGYSRLIRSDEDGTLAALKSLRSDLIGPKLAEHHGRVVKLMGDGLLAEFASVVDAVRAAAEIQQAMVERNAAYSRASVSSSGSASIWATWSSTATTSTETVSTSRLVWRDWQNRAEFAYRRQSTTRCVIAWSCGSRIWESSWSRTSIGRCASGAGFATKWRPTQRLIVAETAAGKTIDRCASLQQPEPRSRPRYFSDGITEDIMTDLSKASGLFVIARNSAFVYKDKTFSAPRVCRELGVKFALEGSIRKAGNRVRVTAQLIEGPHARGGRRRSVLRFLPFAGFMKRSLIALLSL